MIGFPVEIGSPGVWVDEYGPLRHRPQVSHCPHNLHRKAVLIGNYGTWPCQNWRAGTILVSIDHRKYFVPSSIADPWHFGTNLGPDYAFSQLTFKTPTKKLFFHRFFSLLHFEGTVHLDHLSKIKSHKEVAKQQETKFFLLVLLADRRIRIRMFLGLLDPNPDPLVRGTDPQQLYPQIKFWNFGNIATAIVPF